MRDLQGTDVIPTPSDKSGELVCPEFDPEGPYTMENIHLVYNGAPLSKPFRVAHQGEHRIIRSHDGLVFECSCGAIFGCGDAEIRPLV